MELSSTEKKWTSLRTVRSAAVLFFVLHRFVPTASTAYFFPFFLPLPNRQSTVSVRTVALKLVSWLFWTGRESERLTSGQSGWPGAAAVGSTPALALRILKVKKLLLFLKGKIREREAFESFITDYAVRRSSNIVVIKTSVAFIQ